MNIKRVIDQEKILGEDDFIISKTDKKGKIIYCNKIFKDMSGYEFHELIGANHNIIRHPDMPRIAFKLLWDTIKNKGEFFGFVKNLSKDGSYYWVFAYIAPDFDNKGNIISYTSVRRKPAQTAVEQIIPIYQKMISIEKGSGIKASEKILEDLLEAKELEYSEFIINLQLGAII